MSLIWNCEAELYRRREWEPKPPKIGTLLLLLAVLVALGMCLDAQGQNKQTVPSGPIPTEGYATMRFTKDEYLCSDNGEVEHQCTEREIARYLGPAEDVPALRLEVVLMTAMIGPVPPPCDGKWLREKGGQVCKQNRWSCADKTRILQHDEQEPPTYWCHKPRPEPKP